jgi:flavin reductase (DIM6/NTAB) family NADH-FMN oxidoreductase RutF
MVKVAVKPSTYLYPVPAVMVTSGPRERPNIITLAWVGTVCSNPPMVGISIRRSRYSHELITEHGEFAVNLPTAEQVRVVDYCGMVSGRDADKFSGAGLTPLPASAIETVIIAECPVNLECKVQQVLSLGSHDLFLGEIVAVQVDEEVLTAKHQVDLSQAAPLAYGAREYWSLGERLESYGFSVKDR